jgi:hypothetical protein
MVSPWMVSKDSLWQVKAAGSIPAASTLRSPVIPRGYWAFSLASFSRVPSVCPFGASVRSGLEVGHRKVELLHGARPSLGGQVGIALCHLDGRVPHQLLDRLEGHTTHREVTAVGVPQVVPADAALLAADVRLAKRALQRALHGAVRERAPVLLTKHVGTAQVSQQAGP